ncbi:GHKL domain-containing protein [Chryseolinea serpens]|uniref:GHKL domain-containing protein n=1 Tax=Chryseolinea serpens TaxID=947013 RepID=A0A1M5QQY7_9BACT|nr:histidine kinase [Chryseolinea serpens]SHH16013.1 GHKL domain-containing protein [Chryseolinea serpens]
MTNYPSKFDWFFKYKLYHIPFWFAYHYCWWTVTIGSAWNAASNILSFSPYTVKYCFYVVFQAIGVYFNLYFLIPRFLEKGRYAQYIALLMVTIVCTAVFVALGYPVSAWLSEQTFEDLYHISHERYFYFFQVNTLPSTVASMTLAMSIKLTKNWIQSKRREQDLEKAKSELEKEKLETELKFLKSQFNPHFLFNTINSIFVLINKNPQMASDSLAKFSDILRYQLYECNEQQILLDQELNYLENFIELQKLRQDHSHVTVDIQMDIPHTGKLVIAPFILMPFVENAFKHVSRHRNGSNWITMKLRLDREMLRLEVSNSASPLQSSSSEFIRHRGIGLKNVQRRLDLLYPGKYTLVKENGDDQFRIALTLSLHERAMAEPAALTEQNATIDNLIHL